MRSDRTTPARRGGFTLVEMLVSVALVLLMMVIFAEVFQISASAVSNQKGLGENDQRARTLTTIIKGDLNRRTFGTANNLIPITAGEDLSMSAVGGLSTRRGYFYISENDPYDNTDDVLQFTIQIPTGEDTLAGRSRHLPVPVWLPNTMYNVGDHVSPTDRTNGPNGLAYYCSIAGTSGGMEPMWTTTIPGSTPDNGVTWDTVQVINQPDGDDGYILFDTQAPPNQTLIDLVNTFQSNSTGASSGAEVSYFVRNGNLYRRVLLLRNPYEASGTTEPRSGGGELLPAEYDDDYDSTNAATVSFWNDFDYAARYQGGPKFMGLGLLLNDIGGSAVEMPSLPINRFGHDHVTGFPREFVEQPAVTYIGRFTLEECSDVDFGFPGALIDLDGVDQLGDSDFTDDSPLDRNQTLGIFQGVVSYNAGGDTLWGTNDDPRFSGPRRGEDLLLHNVHSFDVKVLDENYNEDRDGDFVLDDGEDVNGNGVLDLTAAFADIGHAGFAGDFQHAQNQLSTTGQRALYGYHVPGNGPDGAPGDMGVDDDGINGMDDAGETGWPGTDDTYNRVFDTWHFAYDVDGDMTDDEPPFRPIDAMTNAVPLRAIQITIRYYDVPSDQMRQVTIVHSLVDD